jgi:hypothetical protein
MPKGIVVVLVFVALAIVAYFGQSWAKRLGPPERCWEIKEEGGQLYKSNPCTGQFLLLGDAPAPAR